MMMLSRINLQHHIDPRELDHRERLQNRRLASLFTMVCAACGTAALTMGGWITGWIIGITFYVFTAAFFGLTLWLYLRGPSNDG